MSEEGARRLWRRAGLVLLVLLVAVLHGLGMRAIAGRLGNAAAPMPPRIEVAYVRELTPTAPPPVAPAPVVPLAVPVAAAAPAASAARPERKARAKPKAKTKAQAKEAQRAPAPAATEPAETRESAPDASSPTSEQRSFATAQAEQAAQDGGTPATTTSPAEEAAPEVREGIVAADAGAATPAIPTTSTALATPATPNAHVDIAQSGAAAFVWPASTRVSYILTGNYRGEVQGDAQVEWVHAGSRYQVHLDLTVGAHFAPLITRRMTSDGEITPEGLSPRSFDQETKLIFHDRHRASLRFERDAVVLADGRRHPRLSGVQDSASQFVQLTYLFTMQPERLQVGRSIEVPLALPRKVDRWIYDVVDEEVLQTSFGPLATFHLKPRRVPQPGGELVSEIWFAPELRYLPVRIRISQDEHTYIDLLIARKPELAAP